MSERDPNDSPIKRALVAIDKLKAKLDLVEREKREPIAIVGAGCRFPGGVVDLASFSARLAEGFDAVTEVPPDRWDIEAYYSADPNAPGKMSTRVGAFLDRIDGFDAAFFGLSPREAKSLDPQHRLMLEVAWEALEDAGCPPARLRGSSTGVFIGMYAEDYAELLAQSPSGGDAYAVTGGARSFAAGRLSYLLDLRGPAMVVDTVCSSSLVAVDTALQALRGRRCDLALAGAVSLMISPATTVLTSKLFALSPSGRCRTFDASADGYVRGEGCAAVVLKRLSDAIAGGDRILGVIRGSAVNHDGLSTSFTAPNVLSQRDVIKRALDDAGVAPAEVSYVEAHGTGTPLGDPIEIDALKAQLGAVEGPKCAVGSVKTNLGHLEAAAGMAGLLKVLTSFASERIPPHLHFSRLNPHIDLGGTRLEIAGVGRPWPRGDKRRIAGISSFGLSGTNAHMIVEEPPDPKDQAPPPSRRVHVLPLSARSDEALKARALAFASELEAKGRPADIAYSAGARREHHSRRFCAVGESPAELARTLKDEIRGEHTEGRRRTVFVYSGQGSQWVGMGRRLLAEEEAFARRMAECDGALSEVAGFSVLEMLKSSPDDPRWQKVDVIQPLLFAIQVSLSAQWMAWGVAPDAVIGHSLGEVAASVVAGTLSLEDGARVIAVRSRLVTRTSGRGRMALVQLSMDSAKREIERLRGVSIASHNGPETVLVSGDTAEVEALVKTLEARGVFGRLVDVDYASHSAHMDELLGDLAKALAGVRGRPAGWRIAQCSTVFADLVDGSELDGAYWCRNLREPVRFCESVERLVSLGHDVFLEISPHPVLVPALEQTIAGRARALGSLRRDHDEIRELSEALARLYMYGVEIDWARRDGGRGRAVALPAYPWQRQRYWMDPPKAHRAVDSGHGWLDRGRVFAQSPDATVFEGLLGGEDTAWLIEHRVNGEAIVPGAVWLEAALFAARETWGAGSHAAVGVEFLEPLPLDGKERRVQIALTDIGEHDRSFEVSSLPSSQAAGAAGARWTKHARGRLRRDEGPKTDPAPMPPFDGGGSGWSAPEPRSAFYEAMRARGLSYGTVFQRIEEVRTGPARALAEIAPPPELGASGYLIHPALLDAALQALAAAAADGLGLALPVGVDRIRIMGTPAARMRAHAAITEESGRQIAGDVALYGEDGKAIAEVRGVRVRRLDRRPLDERLYAVRWELERLQADPKAKGGRWLVFSDDRGESSEILRRLRARAAGVVLVSRGSAFVRSNEEAYAVDPARVDDYRALFKAGGAPFAGILHLWAAETGDPLDAVDAARTAGCGTILHLVKALAGAEKPPPLWIATRAAQPAGETSVDVTHAPLWGLARSLLHEHPELRTTMIDLAPSSGAAEIDALVRELEVGGPENQIALRGEHRFVARVAAVELESIAPAQEADRARGRPHRLEAPHPGLFERLELRAFARRRPLRGEVEIEIAAAGINFLDVLHAMGVYPGQAAGRALLGHECAGRISAVGEGVAGFAPGDEVMAIVAAGLATHTIADARLVFRKPARLSMEAAAGLPLAYLTAQHALVDLARLSPNEKVLIHSASGGVGLAAIAVARRSGAEIFATAGTETKRAYLRGMGIAHVMDSRSRGGTFAEEILQATGGRGVDVVLNSLAGASIERSLSALAPYGRFVEIGKKDIHEGARLSLAHFKKSLSYSAVDVAALVADQPERMRAAMLQVIAGIEAGSLPSLPVEARPLGRYEEAFRTMAAAEHVGKLVLVPGDSETAIRAQAANPIRGDASYLITGGLGGLGLEVAHWLLDQGAKKVVLLGRRGAEGSTVVAPEKQGALVEAIACDVTDRTRVATIVRALAEDRARPLAGIIHAAGVLDDGLLADADWSRFEAVMAPKIRGAQNLHAAAEGVPLDFFVLFSSAASLLGSPAQASYAAANAFLDALAHQRRARNLPAMSVQWGAWAKVGLAAQRTERGDRLRHLGMGSLEPSEALEAFGALLEARPIAAAVIALDRNRWRASYEAAAGTPYFSRLVGEAQPDLGAQADPAAVPQYVRALIAKTFRVPPATLDEERSPVNLGCDSLTALELKNRFAVGLDVAISPLEILRAPSIRALIDRVEEAVRGRSRPKPEAKPNLIVPDPAHRHDPFPLTDIQQAYWIGRSASMELGSVGCHVYTELEQIGLDPLRLERAWRRVIDRHDMLRAIVEADGRQRILAEVPPYAVAIADLRGLSTTESNRAIEAVREQMAHQVFAPDRWPLFDVRVSLLDGDRMRVHFSSDLITADPATLFQVLRDWGDHYRDPELEPDVPELSFRDYMIGAIEFRRSETYLRSKAYWDARVDDLPGPPELPLVRDPASILRPRFRTRLGRLEKSVWDRLKQRADANGITPSAALLAAFADLVDAFSSAPRFTINLTLFTRLPLHPDVHEIVGDFTSTVLLAVSGGEGSFLDRARRLHQQLLEDLNHAHVSGVEVLREMAKRRREQTLMGVVFTSMVGHDDLSSFDWLGEQVMKLTQTPQVYFDHQVLEHRGALVYYWDTIEDLFPDGMVDAMFEVYAGLLGRLASDDGAWHEASVLEIPSAQLERRRRLQGERGAIVPVSESLLHDGFEARVREAPGAPAVISSRRSLSYGELAEESRRIARWLRRQGAQRNQLVALVMEKGWEQVAGALGILQAGAAYLPVDASLPADRIAYLLAHGEVKIALTQPSVLGRITWPEGLRVHAFDGHEPWQREDDTPLEPSACAEDLAYVLYTSGSTGKPKGVAMPHRGPVNTIADINRRLGISAEDRVLALSSLSFDLSVYDVFGLLAAGGAIVLPDPEASRDPAAWLELIQRTGVTLWNSVPALLEMTVEHASGRRAPAGGTLRAIMLSGDWIPVDLPDRARALFEGARVVSLGGPTEASIWQVSYPIGQVDPAWKSIPYGTPLSHQEVHVLDARLRPRPDWVPGELYIGGRGLAAGYWRDEIRTNESFIVDPRTGARLYKSGDLGRWVPQGHIEFVGRNDHQVKIQGHRIELGEIEAALKRHPDVADAVVIAKGAAQKSRSLVAYLVPKIGSDPRGKSVVADGAERIAFKMAEHNLRKDTQAAQRIGFDRPLDLERYTERASRRRYAKTPLPAERLGELLGSLAAVSMEGEPLGKLRYPSAGHLYPVQTYLYVEGRRVLGLEGGVYYYDFKRHMLVLLSASARIDPSVHVPPNRSMAEGSAFSIFFIEQKRAIEPLYGALSRDFCMIEVGAMVQLLMTCAHPMDIGLCEVGALEFDRIAPLFQLDDGHVFLHALVGGPVGAEMDEARATARANEERDLGAELSRHLGRLLPPYMVPSAFVQLERIPLTANGKIDRRALPDPAAILLEQKEDATPPRTELEKKLAGLVCEVARIERVGLRTQLFELGFTSVQVVALARRLRDELGFDVSAVDVFRHPTLEALASFLGTKPEVAIEAGGSARAEKRRMLMEERRSLGGDGEKP